MIAQENFKITLEDGEKIAVSLELHESGAFEYGNKTCVAWYENGKLKDTFDTRYERGCNSTVAFREWAVEFVKKQVRDTVRVERA